MPLLPDDFDPRFHVAVPADQWAHAPLRGDASAEIIGATPAGAWRFRLPRKSPGLSSFARGQRSEHRTHPDTIFIYYVGDGEEHEHGPGHRARVRSLRVERCHDRRVLQGARARGCGRSRGAAARRRRGVRRGRSASQRDRGARLARGPLGLVHRPPGVRRHAVHSLGPLGGRARGACRRAPRYPALARDVRLPGPRRDRRRSPSPRATRGGRPLRGARAPLRSDEPVRAPHAGLRCREDGGYGASGRHSRVPGGLCLPGRVEARAHRAGRRRTPPRGAVLTGHASRRRTLGR
ncbi:MAG: DUF2169 domain-containing protein [Deltaproteobacteria bacterium]|nr:DUF2169 domain-containing protein [Deltaproteobacteria bacterium]